MLVFEDFKFSKCSFYITPSVSDLFQSFIGYLLVSQVTCPVDPVWTPPGTSPCLSSVLTYGANGLAR